MNNKGKLKFGDELAKDYYGRPILVGSVVDEIEYWNGKTHVRRTVVVGLTGGGNLRVMGLGLDYTAKEPKAWLSWIPAYKACLAPENTESRHKHLGTDQVNAYHNLVPNGFDAEYGFHEAYKTLSTSEQKTAGVQL